MNTKPLEKTRVDLVGGFEAFKKQKQEEAGADKSTGLPVAQDKEPAVHDQTIESAAVLAEPQNIEATNLAEPVVVAELGLDEPPDVIEPLPEVQDWAHSIPESTLMAWWHEFIEGQTMRTGSLMKTLRPSVVGTEVVLTVHASKVEVLDGVKFPFNRFINEKSEGKLTNLKIEVGDLVEQERKPYTEKEKLEYLIKVNPKLEDLIQKLGLRLP
ncbi:MAG: hypothetical protein IT244_13475 [Bacteroidia bacterium]|nr:hypothetical protein [Bacteroidia bacterium]